jgi:hypothetical protein
MKQYILLSRKCNSCGGRMAMKSFDHSPLEEEIKEVSEELGGNCCIDSYIFELCDDSISFVDPDI